MRKIHRNICLWRLTIFYCMVMIATCVYAQEINVNKQKNLYVALGSADILDTYLSPFSYNGTHVAVSYENFKKNDYYDGILSFSKVTNPAGNVNEYAGDLRWRYAKLYDIFNKGDFSVKIGPMAVLDLGVLYNERNGNNPAQGRFSLMADLSSYAQYNLRIGKRKFPIRYLIDVPMIGAAFSPNYGQSYYEIFSMKKTDHNVVFAHVGNTPSLRHRLTFDVPTSKGSISLGYMGIYDQSLYNNLRYHSYSHNFIIGFSL